VTVLKKDSTNAAGATVSRITNTAATRHSTGPVAVQRDEVCGALLHSISPRIRQRGSPFLSDLRARNAARASTKARSRIPRATTRGCTFSSTVAVKHHVPGIVPSALLSCMRVPLEEEGRRSTRQLARGATRGRASRRERPAGSKAVVSCSAPTKAIPAASRRDRLPIVEVRPLPSKHELEESRCLQTDGQEEVSWGRRAQRGRDGKEEGRAGL